MKPSVYFSSEEQGKIVDRVFGGENIEIIDKLVNEAAGKGIELDPKELLSDIMRWMRDRLTANLEKMRQEEGQNNE